MMQPSPGPHDSAELVWERVFTNPRHTGATWACLAVAIAHADDVTHQAARNTAAPADAARRGGPLWTRVAVSSYQMLASTGAYRHRGVDLPGRVVADGTAIRTWLRAPDPRSAGGGQTVAELLGVDRDLLHDHQRRHATLARLIDQAQAAGVLRCPNTRVQLWHIANDDAHIVGHRLGLYRDGTILATDKLDLTDLVDATLVGPAAATAAIQRVAELATQVLNGQTPTDPAPVAAFDPPHTRHEVPGWARGFRVGGRLLEASGDPAATATPPPDTAPGGASRRPTR